MKTAIIGAGAMGCLFGGLLTESGADVTLVDVRQEQVDTLNEKGLSFEWRGETRTIAVKATTDPGSIGSADLAIIFVKSLHTPAAAQTAAGLLADGGFALTMQNGMGNADILAEAVGAERVIAGTTAHGATLLGPGHVRHAGRSTTLIGMWDSDDIAPAEKTAAFFTRAGIETDVSENIRSVVWNKLLVNIGINAITALTGIRNGELMDLPQTRELAVTAVEEAAAVARALGIEVAADAVDRMLGVARDTAANRSSMGQDVDSRRLTEIGAINGFVVREADRLGMEVPVNRTLTTLVETMQAHY